MLTDRTSINKLSYQVIGCAIEVHRVLGPGLLERPYVLALAEQLKVEGIDYELDVPVPVSYHGKPLGCGYRMDIVVASTIVLEIKSVRALIDVHHKQLLCYLKLTRLPLGLLINFNVSLLREGISRTINLPPPEPGQGGSSAGRSPGCSSSEAVGGDDERKEQPARRA